MKKILRNIIVETVSLWVIDMLFTGIAFTSMSAMITTAVILALLNSTVRPVLKIMTVPVSILTLGFFSLIVNAVVLVLAFSLSEGAYIDSFFTAFIASIILAFVNGAVEGLFKE